MTREVRIGICSWTDRTLLASGFYPASANTPAGRLAYYSSCFDIVEVDSTYYALPNAKNAFRWVAGTPRNFLFGVKSFSLFTFHRAKFSSLPPWLKNELRSRPGDSLVRREDLTHDQRVRLFEEFIKPVGILNSSGKLAYLLFQFPPNWRFSREALAYIRRLREMSGPIPLALEVRNNSWFEPGSRRRFLDTLKDQNIACTAVDEPAMGWTVPPEWHLTAEWGAVARFHGRNRRGWSSPRASVHERFDYEYARSELAEWAEKAKHLAFSGDDSKKIYMLFNNCVSDKAVRSALLMAEMMGLGGISPPMQGTLDFDMQ
ncbi:MAG: DUF72 domain-containing protein [Synergistaceae bacterium]|jgi:uncharacterized protein YecE (DUF72 family)|nr:DUF72 domain-containing protein [Synergistaceae bacterium]